MRHSVALKDGHGCMTDVDDIPGEWRRTRYEYRVWGKHRKARKLLAELATSETTESVEDCYLLIDDAAWNAKVRDSTLKIKHLVSEDRGFEEWASGRYKAAEDVPSPFDAIFEALSLDRPQKGKKYSIERAVKDLKDLDVDVRPVFVTKERVRYRIGSLLAEVTDIEIVDSDEVLHTVSIEGDDLDELAALRKKLGLKKEPNIAVHQAIDEAN